MAHKNDNGTISAGGGSHRNTSFTTTIFHNTTPLHGTDRRTLIGGKLDPKRPGK